MRTTPYTTVYNAPNSNEAQTLIKRLQNAGFHPAELALTATVPFTNDKQQFPVEVPAEEAGKAEHALKTQFQRRAAR